MIKDQKIKITYSRRTISLSSGTSSTADSMSTTNWRAPALLGAIVPLLIIFKFTQRTGIPARIPGAPAVEPRRAEMEAVAASRGWLSYMTEQGPKGEHFWYCPESNVSVSALPFTVQEHQSLYLSLWCKRAINPVLEGSGVPNLEAKGSLEEKMDDALLSPRSQSQAEVLGNRMLKAKHIRGKPSRRKHGSVRRLTKKRVAETEERRIDDAASLRQVPIYEARDYGHPSEGRILRGQRRRQGSSEGGVLQATHETRVARRTVSRTSLASGADSNGRFPFFVHLHKAAGTYLCELAVANGHRAAGFPGLGTKR